MRGILIAVRFAVVQAAQNFVRNFAVSMAGVFTMGLIILLVGGTLLVTHTVNSVLAQQEQQADVINIFLQDSLSMRTIAEYEYQFSRDPRVNGVSFTSKDQAVQREANQGINFQGAINALGSNPLPASINLHVQNLGDLTQMNTLASALPIVDSSQGHATSYSPNIIPRLQSVIFWTELIGWALSAVLALISLVIIMNTIRTAVFIRRTEIEIMKLVGAGDWFVRWPFILEGMLGGVLAAVFGSLIVSFGYRFVLGQANAHAFLGISVDSEFATVLVLLLILGGAVLGAVGSLIGVRRFLNV
jgi:cell division transport system permease protein